jgi:hypothetical protein
MITVITNEHVDRIVELLGHDVAVTIGGVYEDWIRDAVAAERALFDEWRAAETEDQEESDWSVDDFYVRVAVGLSPLDSDSDNTKDLSRPICGRSRVPSPAGFNRELARDTRTAQDAEHAVNLGIRGHAILAERHFGEGASRGTAS